MNIPFTRKNLFAATLLVAFIAVSAFKKQEDHQFTNLKILPKNISHDSLETVMHNYNTALGVKCGFCHSKTTDGAGHSGFASDDNKHKAIARKMMEMTADINQKYFNFGGHDAVEAVSCITCHHGKKEPSDVLEAIPGAPGGTPEPPKGDQPGNK